MKKTYHAPVAKKIDYAFDEQITAQSVPINDHTDWYHTEKVCTWGQSHYMCNIIYNTPKTKSLDQCMAQGDIPLG